MTTTTTTTTEAARSFGFDLEAVPEADRDRVAKLIPSPSVADAYIGRDLLGVPDFDVFAAALVNSINIRLEGPTGSAKTTSARAFAASAGLPFYAIPINGGVDPGQMWGGLRLDENGTHYLDAEAFLVAKYGGVLVYDEFNMAHARILASLHPLLDVRRVIVQEQNHGQVVKASGALLMIATMNPGYEGTARMNSALLNRFAWTFDWGYLREVELQLVASPTLVTFAERVRMQPEVKTPTPTNALMEYAEAFDIFGATFARGILMNRYQAAERAGVARAFELDEPGILSELTEAAEAQKENA